MRSEEEYQEALRLIQSGLNDSAIGRALGVPRGTLRDWRAGGKLEVGDERRPGPGNN